MSKPVALRYVRGGAVTYPPGTTFGPRDLHDFEAVWVVEGQAVYHHDDCATPAPPGSIALCRPGVRDSFTWDPDRPTRHAFFHCLFEHLPADWPTMGDWPAVVELPEHDVVRPLFRYVLAWCGQQPGRPAVAPPRMVERAVETMMGALLLGPLGQAPEHGRDYPLPVARAIEMMRTTLQADPSTALRLADLARAASVSPEHLCRLFAETFGAGPMEAVQLLRLDTAVQYIARSNLTLKEIADRCGFGSPYHFSRRFTKVYGRPPSEIRRRIGQGQPPPINRLSRFWRPE